MTTWKIYDCIKKLGLLFRSTFPVGARKEFYFSTNMFCLIWLVDVLSTFLNFFLWDELLIYLRNGNPSLHAGVCHVVAGVIVCWFHSVGEVLYLFHLLTLLMCKYWMWESQSTQISSKFMPFFCWNFIENVLLFFRWNLIGIHTYFYWNLIIKIHVPFLMKFDNKNSCFFFCWNLIEINVFLLKFNWKFHAFYWNLIEIRPSFSLKADLNPVNLCIH